MTFYVRTAVDPSAFLVNIPKVVAKLDANLPVENLRTLTATGAATTSSSIA